MRLLDRYLLRELLVPLGYCLGGFLVFWITYDVFTELRSFQRNHLALPDIAEYYVVKAPELMVMVIPIALLLALLYALTNHARHHELAAIRAAGVPLWRLAVPYFLVAFLAGTVLFLLNERAVPDGAEKAELILTRRSGSAEATDRQWQRSILFMNSQEGRTWYIGAYHPLSQVMLKVHIEWRLPDGTRRQIDAERGFRTNDMWVFERAQEVTLPAGSTISSAPVKHDVLPLPDLTETPRLIQSEIKVSRLDQIKTAKHTHLSIAEIHNYLRLHPHLDAQRRDVLLTMMHNQLALPWTCMVVVLIALPFGAASGRRNVFVGVASSVFICFIYFVVRELSLALGGSGTVEPWLAAWAPNILFGTTGIVMTQGTR